MITIDGSEGEGGGQVVRNALALSLVTGQPFRVEKARANRSKPGLMRQHVTAIEAACAIGNAECEGVAVGASDFTFRPGKVVAGEHRFAVGTAGSTNLVLQTILLPLLLADGPSRIVLEGGTHNVHAPPFDFLAKSFLPLVERMGPRISARLVRHGFYPSGGGRIEVEIVPARLGRIELTDRGDPVSVRGRAVVASLPRDIAEREIDSARKDIDWPEDAFSIEQLPSDQGPGNIFLLEAEFAHHTEVTSGFGQLGVSAQSIGRKTASRMAGYIRSGTFAGPYLADQLLLPMALAGGGAFTTVKPSQHALTAANVIRRFLDRHIVFDARKGGAHHVEIR